ncbi:glycoside hydrolase family 16 protein [Pluteus cervinus]|uniref:Glycoside hydrolase family 16 protein n=1 Tax=Pluteus cervinus TaxID=181527 RepID=A0ACD3AEB3_9AGAR|nr:glycoside hydrolase family 16 protein [Pluteus cervinus]
MYKDVNLSNKVARERQKSTMLSATAPDGIPKPWLETRDPFARIAYWITYGAMFLGLAAGALRCYTGYFDVPVMTGNLCPVLDEDFTGGEDGIFGENGTFFREVDMSGFGNGEFEMTTDSSNNSYIQDGQLWIVPTFTSDSIGDAAIIDGYTYNITDCTYNITHGFSYTPQAKNVPVNVSAVGFSSDFDAEAYALACSATSNHSIAQVINPIQTARLNTRRTASIKFGRVDVRAKLPTGCLWPAIWMLPVDNAYGPWPISGEIDIMESRGNGPEYPFQGSNVVRGSLNWGPLTWLNAVSKTFGFRQERRGRFDREYHVYSMEWSENFIRLFVDNRLHYTLELQVKKSFWDIGDFPEVVSNNSQSVILANPWTNGTKMAPFDQPFYLILSLGVGGTNGWFPDDNGKPWLNGAQNAMAEFWRRKDEWYSSWGATTEDRAFIIDYVKMWQKC